MEVAELTILGIYHLACSRFCWNFEFANRSRKHGGSVPGQEEAPERTPKYLARPSTSPLEETPSRASLQPQNTLLPASVGTTTDVVEVPVSTPCTALAPAFKVSTLKKIQYRADILNAYRPAQAEFLISTNHIKKLRIMISEGRGLNDLGPFSVAVKTLPRTAF